MTRQYIIKSGLIVAVVLCAAWMPISRAHDGDPEDRLDQVDQNTQRDFDREQQRDADDLIMDRSDQPDGAETDAEDRTKDTVDFDERDTNDEGEAVDTVGDDANDDDNLGDGDDAEDGEDGNERQDTERDLYGSSETMRDLAENENPDEDERGFPVRRGEVVALDLSDAGLANAQAQGFVVIERTPLASLGSIVTRLSAPKNMNAAIALTEMRRLDASGNYDLTHYYATQFIAQGTRTAATLNAKLSATKGMLKVGMIDTGVAAHTVLKNAQIKQRDFSNAKATATTEHGTAIASLLARDGANQIYAANIFQGTGAKPYTSADAIVRALDWMVGQDVVVINISLAGPRNKILDALIARALEKGHVIVAAAGNGGPTAPPAYPAALPNVIAVTAVDRNLRVYRYANQGRYITVSAHGVGVTAAAPGGGTGSYTGTSFAAPHITTWMARCAKTVSTAIRQKCMTALAKSAQDLGAPGKDEVYGLGYIQ